MMDMKDRIAASVLEIDNLNRDIDGHWSMIQKFIAEKRVDEAISLLNAYFGLKTKLEQVESMLQGTLKGHFSGR